MTQRLSITLERHNIMTQRLAITLEQHNIMTQRLGITLEQHNIMTQRLAITLERHNIMTQRLAITTEQQYIMTSPPDIMLYITNLVCYAYFHWLFNPECQHIFGKQTGYICTFSVSLIWVPKNNNNVVDKNRNIYASLNQYHNTE